MIFLGITHLTFQITHGMYKLCHLWNHLCSTEMTYKGIRRKIYNYGLIMAFK